MFRGSNIVYELRWLVTKIKAKVGSGVVCYMTTKVGDRKKKKKNSIEVHMLTILAVGGK